MGKIRQYQNTIITTTTTTTSSNNNNNNNKNENESWDTGMIRGIYLTVYHLDFSVIHDQILTVTSYGRDTIPSHR